MRGFSKVPARRLHSAACRRTLVLSAVLLSLAGCHEQGSELPQSIPAEAGSPHPTPSDIHEFISAEGTAGQRSNVLDAGSAPASGSADEASSTARTVEEGDIYRVLSAGKLLNLNPYRGLQVVDIADVTKPRVVGRLKEAGRPVEMYVIGQRAVVLLNNWTGYYGKLASISTERRNGGLVLNVDLSDPAAPKVTDREFVPGSITTSRVTREGDRAALYVASYNWDCTQTSNRENGCASTIVQSLDVTGADLIPRTKLDLGGYVSAVQATPNALIVGRTNYQQSPPSSQVSLIDISHIDGQMVEGPQVSVSGQLQSKFNLDLSGKVLRVVSGSRWGVGQTNHLETFDTSDPSKLTAIDHCTFGDGQNLFATLFMPDRAFFVTFLRVDPFHAFALDAQGHCQERNEFVVSGWNDFFKPVFENRRLIGIGRDGENGGGNVAVSLYDTTNLDNPNPLVAREQIDAQNSSSTASWDDKAFTVLENAVSIPARADANVLETGLALIPFTTYGTAVNGGDARAGVQLFTFSERTLTRRGEMNHGQPVERSFRTDGAITGNLGAEDLSLFDTTNPDAPAERGRVELAPSYSDVHDFGGFLVRVHDTRAAYGSWWSGNSQAIPNSYAETIAKGGDPDSAVPLAKVAIPAGSRTFRVGNLLVVTSTTVLQTATLGPNGLPSTQSTIAIYDLTNPAQPVQRSSLQTDRLLPAYGYGYGGYYGGYRGIGCGVVYGNYYDDFSRVLPNSLVFGRNLPHQESLGQYENCSRYDSSGSNAACAYGEEDCSWEQGAEYCSRKVGTDVTTCEGGYAHCERKSGKVTCTSIEKPAGSVQDNCYTTERFRSWQSMELDVLDLQNPDAPKLSQVNFAIDEEAVGLVASGQSVYFAFKKPFTIDGDPRPFSKYYFREVGLSDPAHPNVAAAVNVPGQLLAVSGTQLFTRDLRWGSSVAETWLHTVRRVGDQAELVASQQFADREVTSVLVDQAARVYVAHRQHYGSYYYYDPSREQQLDKLNIYSSDNLSKLGETEVDSWSSMTQVVDGRVLFSVPGGMMIVNAQTPSAPYAQAYFPHEGYFTNNLSFDGASLYVASGPYGIHQMDATTHNLLAP